jgi:hypothetical protein
MILPVVEFELSLEAETSSTIEAGKDSDDRETAVWVTISVGLVGLVHERAPS